jgi:hypothetical protein
MEEQMSSLQLLQRREATLPPEIIDIFGDSTITRARQDLLYLKPCTDAEAALDLCQITPFIDKSVEKYKNERVKQTIWGKLDSGLILLMMISGGLITAISLMVAIFTGAHLLIYDTRDALNVFVWAIIALAAGAASFAFGSICEKESRKAKTWHRVSLEEYRGVIPEFALITALRLKDVLPTALFFVDELRIKQLPSDPFLVLINSGGDKKEYYIEVWDEPGFKAMRKV